MINYIYLPATGKKISLGAYVAAWKMAISNPHVEFKHGLTTWWPRLGREIRQEFIDGLHDRINQREIKTIPL